MPTLDILVSDPLGVSVWPWLDLNERVTADNLQDVKRWPKISIVTPNYNYGHLIEMTMRSVILQGYPNLEYIVIDGGSSDNSAAVIEQYQPHLAYFEHQPDRGQYHAINKGFAKATGEICAWLNSDDIYMPWTLRVVAGIFLKFPDVHWIMGRSTVIQDGVVHEVRPFRSLPSSMIRAGLFHENHGGYGFIQQESCFWRRSLWERAGGLREELRYAADFELWTRFANYEELHAVSTVLGGFSIRGNENRSRANRESYLKDVRNAVHNLRQSHPQGTMLERRLSRREYVRRHFGGRVAAMLFPIEDLRGPTLKWNFDEGGYVSGTASVY
jgi:glycosyltransferase involved in cell wall biosynthesis